MASLGGVLWLGRRVFQEKGKKEFVVLHRIIKSGLTVPEP